MSTQRAGAGGYEEWDSHNNQWMDYDTFEEVSPLTVSLAVDLNRKHKAIQFSGSHPMGVVDGSES